MIPQISPSISLGGIAEHWQRETDIWDARFGMGVLRRLIFRSRSVRQDGDFYGGTVSKILTFCRSRCPADVHRSGSYVILDPNHIRASVVHTTIAVSKF